MLTGKRYQSPARTDVSASWKFHVQLTDGAKIRYPLERVELRTFCSPAATLSIPLICQAQVRLYLSLSAHFSSTLLQAPLLKVINVASQASIFFKYLIFLWEREGEICSKYLYSFLFFCIISSIGTASFNRDNNSQRYFLFSLWYCIHTRCNQTSFVIPLLDGAAIICFNCVCLIAGVLYIVS